MSRRLRSYPIRRFTAFALLAAALLAPTAALRGQQTTSWYAQYFDNQHMVGEPKISRQEGPLFFDWGIHSPGEGVPADGFSARFGADPYLEGGTYRFEFLADDGINFFVDFQKIIGTFDAPRPGQKIVADVTLEAGQHHFQVDYREVVGYANLRLTWYNIASPPAPRQYPADTIGEGGVVVIPDAWYAQYYKNPELLGAPLVTHTSRPINFDVGAGSPQPGSLPEDNWSARFSINHTLQGGQYTATLEAHHDDGLRFIVDGQAWLDTFGHRRAGAVSATRELAPGPHTLIIEYSEHTHYAFLKFQLRREGAGSAAPAPAAPVAGAPAGSAPVSQPAATPYIDVISYGEGRVSSHRLNVRQFPDTRDSRVLTVTTSGVRHPIVGRNADGSWLQIVADGQLGWVYARYLQLNASAQSADIPITNRSATALRPETGYQLVARVRANIRAYPGQGEALLGTLPRGAQAPIVGRSDEWGWWQIRYDGMQGWVAAEQTRIDTRLLLPGVPITSP